MRFDPAPGRRLSPQLWAIVVSLALGANSRSDQAWPEMPLLSGGASHALVIREGGQLWGIGLNQSAALGAETNDFPAYATNRFICYRIGAGSDWRGIESMGDSNGTTFALRTQSSVTNEIGDPIGQLWAWGNNASGQLGDGTGVSRKTPSRITGEQTWTCVSARGGSVFAVRADGSLWAWGLNEPGSGALGIGRGRARIQYSPVQVGTNRDWKKVQASLGTVLVVTNREEFSVTNSNGVVSIIATNVVRTLTAGKGGAGLRGSGEIWAWGSTFAQVALVGTNIAGVVTNFVPVRIGTGTNWRQLVFGHATFALRAGEREEDGLSLWKFNVTGDFEAFPSTTNPVHGGWKSVRGIQTGEGTNARGHVVGVQTDGTLWAWGDNRQGQVDPQLNAEVIREEPWQITGIDGVEDNHWVEVGAGPGFSLAMTKTGQVFTWGALGFTPPGVQRIPVRVKLPANASANFSWTHALAGSDFSLGVDQDGSLYGWGVTGMVNPSRAVVRTPQLVDAVTNNPNPAWASSGWTEGLASLGRTVVAINGSRVMKIWGDSEETDYQLPWWNPLRVAEGIREFGTGWVRVTGNRGLTGSGTNTNPSPASGAFGVAVLADGSLRSWGDNEIGQLGDGTTLPRDEPQRVGNDANWAGVQAGAKHVLAWKKDGSLWGWGVNSNGELGLTTSTLTVSNFYSGGTNETNASQAKARVYAGRTATTTILLASNTLTRPRLLLDRGWGFTNTNHSPVSAGGSHTLLLRGDGSLWAMGANDNGQLGLGNVVRPSATSNVTTGNSSSTPSWVRTRTVSNVITNINVAPWRRETNIDTTIDEAWMYRPQRVGQKSWKSISAGERHSLAVRADGTLWAWGDNSSAQLGIGNLVPTNQPVQVGAANRWVRAFAGRDHSLGLQQDGSLWAWGKNDGRLGIDADAAEGSPFHELSFGQNLQGTLTLESAGRGTNRILGVGFVRFQPRASNVTMVIQLDIPGMPRAEWSGGGSFRAARHFLSFGTNLNVGPSGGTGGGSPGTFLLREVQSGWLSPDKYQGTAVVQGVPCRATLLFDGDVDRDGIPDGVDATPAGLPPVFTNRIEIRIRVGEQTNVYETPGLGEGVTPILSSDLSDLPLGLSYTNGRIEGSPQREAVKIHDGFYEVVVGAANEGGESYQTLKIQVVPPDPMPALDKEIVSWTNGSDSFVHTIALKESGWKNYYQKYPVEFRGQNIPPGLILERDTGKLRPASPGATNVPNAGLYRMPYTITHRGGGVASGTLVVKSQRIWRVGRPLLYAVRLGGAGNTTVSNLPAGLTFSAANGSVQGIPRVPGTYTGITAKQGNLEQTFELEIVPDPTVKLSALPASGANAKRRGAGWRYPAIFSLGPVATQRVESSGQVRNLPASSAGSYALVWTNVDGWKWAEPAAGLASRLQESETLLRKNQRTEIQRAFPGALRLARISYDSAVAARYLPTNHAYWLRNARGEPAVSDRNPGEQLLDFSQPEWLRLLGERVKFLVQNGCVDGVYLPDWNEAALWPAGSQPAQGEAGESQVTARLELLRILRQAVGPQGWVMAEAAGDSWSLTGPMLDGIHLVAATESPTIWPPTANWWPDPYMLRESGSKLTLWERLANSLKAFAQEGVLRRPGVVALELWSRYDSRDPRTKTPRLTGLALSLCLSEGAYLYASPDWWQEKGRPLPPGAHVWYAEWGASLGLPMGEPSLAPDPRGVYQREFEKGWAVYARPDQAKSVELEFPDAVKSWATGKSGREHTLPAGQGDIFLKK